MFDCVNINSGVFDIKQYPIISHSFAVSMQGELEFFDMLEIYRKIRKRAQSIPYARLFLEGKGIEVFYRS